MRDVVPAEAGFRGAVLDVDGVLVDSPHERAWRETLEQLMTTRWSHLRTVCGYAPDRFTSRVYQDVVAGRPRLDGARAALEHFGVPDAAERAGPYAELKQARVVGLIEAGEFAPFPDALRFVLAVSTLGLRIAAASSSRNAGLMLEQIRLDDSGRRLRDLFTADLSGRDLAHGKPDPEIFLAAAAALDLPPDRCFVVEDAVVGVEAARAAGMAVVGVARADDLDELTHAGADLVVTTLDDVRLDLLAQGRLVAGG
jgi:beta-phosphoglucomutase-like phosphatase (HAD superfamily)